MDATVKPLYRHQEQAVLGYNPGNPADRRMCIAAISSRPFA
jgi:hypothetical protein